MSQKGETPQDLCEFDLGAFPRKIQYSLTLDLETCVEFPVAASAEIRSSYYGFNLKKTMGHVPTDIIGLIVSFCDFPLSVGDKVEVLDSADTWCIATVRRVEEGRLYIHFDGWSAKYDIWHDIDSENWAPMFTSTDGMLEVPKYIQYRTV